MPCPEGAVQEGGESQDVQDVHEEESTNSKTVSHRIAMSEPSTRDSVSLDSHVRTLYMQQDFMG